MHLAGILLVDTGAADGTSEDIIAGVALLHAISHLGMRMPIRGRWHILVNNRCRLGRLSVDRLD